MAFTKSFSAKPASKYTLHVIFYLLDIGRNCLSIYFSQVFCINLNAWNVHTDVTAFAQVLVLVLVLGTQVLVLVLGENASFYMVVVILQLLVVLYTGLMILREVISLNCTNVIAPLMSPNTILLIELSMYGTVFQTLLSRLLACYHFVTSWLNLSSFCVNF